MPQLLVIACKVGERMCWAREQRELKQYWVAKEAGLEVGRYCRMEKDNVKNVHMNELLSIAAVLHCSLVWLSYGGKHDPWPPGEAPTHTVSRQKWQDGEAQQGNMQI